LILGYTNKQICKALDLASRTVKAYLQQAYIIYDIDHEACIPRVRLVATILYERNPELVPYFDGDRAAQWGYLSAYDFVRTLDEAEAYREGGSTPRKTAKLSDGKE
jgi:hypothetical protein